jgi:beta-lactam-binding protein with PASTA domain
MDAAKTVTATFGLVPHKKVFCIVPNVKRKPLSTAKRQIVAAHCRTGRVRKAYSKTVRKGRVISQRPRAGKKLVRGSKVNLVVSRGKG